MTETRLSLILLAGLLLLVACGPLVATPRGETQGSMELSATEYDFGSVPNTGPVSQIFEVRNSGKGPLEILGVSTSCGCTTAEVGSQQLAAGESTDLTVTYDPLAHGGATGEFMRIVYVRSNDPDTPETNLTIRVTVVAP